MKSIAFWQNWNHLTFSICARARAPVTGEGEGKRAKYELLLYYFLIFVFASENQTFTTLFCKRVKPKCRFGWMYMYSILITSKLKWTKPFGWNFVNFSINITCVHVQYICPRMQNKQEYKYVNNNVSDKRVTFNVLHFIVVCWRNMSANNI